MVRNAVHKKIVQRNKSELANAYPSWFRKIEWIALVLFFILVSSLFYKIVLHFYEIKTLLFPALLLGWVGADIASGIIHWAGDTWGSADTFILGPALIRPFREHHVDAKAMTRHDFVETNASCALGGIPILVASLLVPFQTAHWLFVFLDLFVFFLMLFVLMTNQIHKWCHQDHPPKGIGFLQKYKILLNPKHHNIHHTPPFNTYYCITTGWMNWILYKIQFFPTMEKIITKMTGAIPRKDDIGEEAAKSLLIQTEMK